jgi:hypothetical protein
MSGHRLLLLAAALALLLSQATCGEPADPGAAEVERLVRQLGSDSFRDREAAAQGLERIGEPAVPALRGAARESPDLEVRRRARELVEILDNRRPGLDPDLGVLLRHSARRDKDHRSPFFAALGSLARKHGARTDDYLHLPEGLFVLDGGFAVRAGAGHVVAVLEGDDCFVPGSDLQQLLLLDRRGRVRDRLSCEISNRLARELVDSGTFRTDVLDPPGADGATLVIRYIPEKGGRVAGHWHVLTVGGRAYSFSWDQDRPDAIRSAVWEKKGLCRVAVRGGKFAVLFPDLKAADTDP